MKAPRITKDSNGYWDLKMTNGRVEWAEDGVQAAQHAVQRLGIFYGEWILDIMRDEDADMEVHPKIGTQWYQIMFKTSKSKAEKELHIRSRIMETPGIKGIDNWSWTQTGHSLAIGNTLQPVQVITDWGVVDIAAEISAL